MKYVVEFTEQADKTLKKLNPIISKQIKLWLNKNIEGCTNPRQHGKALVGNLGGLWRYRIGDYRAICKIEDNRLIVLVLQLGHRKSIYK